MTRYAPLRRLKAPECGTKGPGRGRAAEEGSRNSARIIKKGLDRSERWWEVEPERPGSRGAAASERRRRSGKAEPGKVCVFCRNNGAPEEVFASHVLKAADGRVLCPVLRAYTCPLCGANGDHAHTIKYCPLSRDQQPSHRAAKGPRTGRGALAAAAASERRRRSGKAEPGKVCVFCRNNGAPEEVFASHVLKAADGRVLCPVLRAYTCPLCGANGDHAHTIKYCPLSRDQQPSHRAAKGPRTVHKSLAIF
ncbi:hypothetical protein CRUP_016380 [Coryphaenoides rupestris]|nr:hypothetical protein CRUP_016380 [Coryphaenoides rupestris]